MNPNWISVVEGWFHCHQGGLYLPDGWFGKPYDNLHSLFSIVGDSTNLIVTLDHGKLVLHFYHLERIFIEDNDLVFGPFDSLRFSWHHYDSDAIQEERTYKTGEVRIVQ